jgi:hypothetical protein
MEELGLDELQSGGHGAKVSRPLAELHFLVMQAEQEKERRRLVIATLEALVGSNWIDLLARRSRRDDQGARPQLLLVPCEGRLKNGAKRWKKATPPHLIVAPSRRAKRI